MTARTDVLAAQHTPTPWKLERLTGGGYHNVGIRVAGPVVSGYAAFINTRWANENQCAEQEANAAFIVRACNSHEQLVALVRRAQEILGAYLPPDGSSDQEAITALLELFDGPESRDALAAAGAA